MRFVSQLVSVTRDRSGNVIDGNPDKVTDVTDVWTFARDVSSRDPNWKLVATEAGQYQPDEKRCRGGFASFRKQPL